MTEHEWNIPLVAEIGDPVPGKNALHGDGDVRQEGFDSALQEFGVDGHVFVKQRLAVGVENADVHGFCVQVDAAIVRMLLGVVSHLVLREFVGF